MYKIILLMLLLSGCATVRYKDIQPRYNHNYVCYVADGGAIRAQSGSIQSARNTVIRTYGTNNITCMER